SICDLCRAIWHSGGGGYRPRDDTAGLQDSRRGEYFPLPGADWIHHPADVLNLLAGALWLQWSAEADRRDCTRTIPAIWRRDHHLAGGADHLGRDCVHPSYGESPRVSCCALTSPQ